MSDQTKPPNACKAWCGTFDGAPAGTEAWRRVVVPGVDFCSTGCADAGRPLSQPAGAAAGRGEELWLPIEGPSATTMSDQGKPDDETPTPMASSAVAEIATTWKGWNGGPIKPTVTVIDLLLPHGGGGGGGGALTYGPGDQEAILAALDAARKESR